MGEKRATTKGIMADYHRSQTLGMTRDQNAHMRGKEQFSEMLSEHADQVMQKSILRSRHKSIDCIKANLELKDYERMNNFIDNNI